MTNFTAAQFSSTENRTVLITGAAGGIGRASVQVFAQAGWTVIGVDRAPFEDPFPTDSLFIQADISDPKDLEAIFSQVKSFTKRLDALVNNAAVQITKPLVETSVEEWDSVMASNLRSVFLADKTVMGRVGKPEEIARAIYFLADEKQSSFMTGQALVVDGGATARLSTE
jgi:NAD(P)-dependent dehydrogenase (short-subunit alcohol dehydrogenase family)